MTYGHIILPSGKYHSDSHATYYKQSTHSAKEQASELNCRARLTFVSHDKPNRPWAMGCSEQIDLHSPERWRTRERQRYNSQQSCTSLTVTHSVSVKEQAPNSTRLCTAKVTWVWSVLWVGFRCTSYT